MVCRNVVLMKEAIDVFEVAVTNREKQCQQLYQTGDLPMRKEWSRRDADILIKVIVKRVFISRDYGILHSAIVPQALECAKIVQRHSAVGIKLRFSSNKLSIFLKRHRPTLALRPL